MEFSEYRAEEVPIELFEPGDWVESMIGEGSGQPYVWRVENKKFVHRKAAGEPQTIVLEAARETDMYGTGMEVRTEGPPGTIVQRAIPLS